MSEEQESFSFESRDWLSQIQVETFQHQISILNKPNGNFGQRFRLDLFDFEISGEVFVLILWFFQIVGVHWIEDWFSFEIRFSRERIQICESWEPWSSIKLESTFRLVFVFDSLMADQQTQNTSIVEEKKVPPTDEVEEEPVPKVESPVPPVAKSRAPELTESPKMVASLAVELTTAKTEVDALVGAITESSTRLENVDGQEGTSHWSKWCFWVWRHKGPFHRSAQLRWSRLPRSNWTCYVM